MQIEKFSALPMGAFFTFPSDDFSYKKIGDGHAMPTTPYSDCIAEISPDAEVFWQDKPTPFDSEDWEGLIAELNTWIAITTAASKETV